MTEAAQPPAEPGSGLGRTTRILLAVTCLYLVQSAYLGVSSAPTLFYVGNIFCHVFGGGVLAILLLWWGVRAVRRALSTGWACGTAGVLALALFVACLLAAGLLLWVGNTRDHAWVLRLHIALASASVPAALLALWTYGARRRAGAARVSARWLGAATAAALVLLGGFAVWGAARPQGWNSVSNPERPPFRMAGEAMGGADGPFFPSSAETSTGGRIPSNFFMTGKTCGQTGCHADIFRQWSASAHRFSSFNNQWYRRSVEYMQQVNSVQSSKWCGGCHDHAVIFNGMMDRPIQEIVHTPEAQVGLSCNSCHAVVHVKNTMGNGGFYIEYPPLHDMATSDNPVLKGLHDLAVYLDPGPHRRVFLKPFHRRSDGQQARFCSACHKVHLDVPVNNYRWIRGFNEYDNWQASGVSGQGARSFYYPPAPRTCGDCHMPLVHSNDKGNRGGFVHDHSFLAANTALPLSKLKEDQLRRVIEFLQADQVTVDVFAAGPARLPDAPPGTPKAARGETPDTLDIASTFAVGEEAATPVGRGGVPLEPLAPLWAPLDRANVRVRPGEEVRVDVVVRTRGVGHFFPGGTVDAFDVWLELRATDSRGRTIFWSGVARDGGRGPVEDGAHFYRALMVDAHGNPVNKRNAWATRTLVYVNLIPPGAADVAHFRLTVPQGVEGEITLEARLNYRKFSAYNTAFSFSGRPAPGEPPAPGPGVERVTKHWDDRRFVFGEVPEDVSAEVREVPDLPIVVMDRDTAVLRVAKTGEEPGGDVPAPVPDDRLRWNDYGIGLLRQGDLKGAERAFQQVIRIAPDWPEGYVNVARARLQEGDLEGAGKVLQKALALAPDLAKVHYFLGVYDKEKGNYDEALEHLRTAARQYPRDRVVRNAIGRILFLQRKFADAITELRKVTDVDPEDLSAHYNLMLCFKGLGRAGEADAERRLYERFKADEDSQVITGPYRREHPEDNRERQPIHEHVSVPEGVIAEETAIRERAGEPDVVLPGQAREYAHRAVARGLARKQDLQARARPPSGPSTLSADGEAGEVR